MNVCMLSYSFYESDNRVRRYAETLVKRGDSVDVISLRREGEGDYNELNGVKVHRIQKRVRSEKNRWDYLYKILRFFFLSGIQLTKKHMTQPYHLIHVHSVPDFEVFAALIPKIMRAKIILDIHDIVPELYASKFQASKSSLLFRALTFIEKAAIGFSDHVIISNHIWYKTLLSRSVKPEKCSTILNYPDPDKFYKPIDKINRDKIILLYPGTLNYHQGLDIAVNAFAKICCKYENLEFHIYGDGPSRNNIIELIDEYGLKDRIFIYDMVSLDQISKIMAMADIGVVPKRNDSFGGEAFSTKILEFMSLNVPVVASRTKIDSYYFNDTLLKYFTPECVDDLADSMAILIEDENLRVTLANNASKFMEEYSWEKRKNEYIELVDRITRLNKL